MSADKSATHIAIWQKVPREERAKVTGMISRRIAEISKAEYDKNPNKEPSEEYGAFCAAHALLWAFLDKTPTE